MQKDKTLFVDEQEYENEISTKRFISYIYSKYAFIIEYLDYILKNNYITKKHFENFKLLINRCIEIHNKKENNVETYRQELMPLMEWMTDECGHMNIYYKDIVLKKSVTNRTRSKSRASVFKLHPVKRRKNAMTLEPIKEGAIIHLSDNNEYTYKEIKQMWKWNKTMTPYRHSYTEEDKKKIKDLLDFVTKGGQKNKTKKLWGIPGFQNK